MASLRKRGGLQWQARSARKGYPVQVKTFNTKAAAEAWARALESEMERGSFVSRVEAESTALLTCIERYMREVCGCGLAGCLGCGQQLQQCFALFGTELPKSN